MLDFSLAQHGMQDRAGLGQKMTDNVRIHVPALPTAMRGPNGRPRPPLPNVKKAALSSRNSGQARTGAGRGAHKNKTHQGVTYEKRPDAGGLGPGARHRRPRLRPTTQTR